MTTRSLLLRALATALCAAVFASCSPSETDGADPAPNAQQAESWELPLDHYGVSESEMIGANHAEDLLASECMTDAGLSWSIPAIDTTPPRKPTRTEGNQRLLTEEIATTYGYREPPIYPEQTLETLSELASRSLSVSEQSTLDKCIADAQHTLPIPADEMNFSSALTMNAYIEAGHDSEVEQAAGRWRECMQPQGISDLPALPDGGDSETMPSASLRERFRMDRAADQEDEADEFASAGAEEVAIAVADVRCRQSSGFNKAFYAAQWRLQSQALAESVDQLESEQKQIEAWLAQSHEVLAQRAGK